MKPLAKKDISALATKSLLSNKSLTAEIVTELLEVARREHNHLLVEREHAKSKARIRQLKKLQNRVKSLAKAFEELDDQIKIDNGELSTVGYEKKVNEWLRVIERALAQKGRVGNVETDLDQFVYEVARTMIRHQILPERYGNEFNSILYQLFDAVGENTASVRAAIDRAWTDGGSRRLFSIETEIERAKDDGTLP